MPGDRPPEHERMLLVELDGPEVSPATVDAVLLLELAASFFSLVKANAQDLDESFGLRGLHIIDKCVAVGGLPSNLVTAISSAARAAAQVAGTTELPFGSVDTAKRVRRVLRRLDPSMRVVALAGKWSHEVALPAELAQPPLDEIIVMRAVPLRIGGEKNMSVRLRARLEEDFTLKTSEEKARELGAHLWREVEIEAHVRRDGDGDVVGGVLLDFEPLDAGDAHELWRNWLREVSGDYWDTVDDLDRELRG